MTNTTIIMDAYEKQAQEFLENHYTTITIEYIGRRTPKWGTTPVNAYWFTIERATNNTEYSGTYYDSIHNTENGIEPTAYDILSAVWKSEVGTFFEFCNEFGYDTHDESGECVNVDSMEIYKAVLTESLAMNEMFEDCMDELYEIA